MNRTQAHWGWEFVSPSLLILGLFVLVPSLWGIGMSFTHYDGVSSPRFVGTSQYERLLQDPMIWKTLWNTGFYVLLTLPAGILLGLGIALAIHQKWFSARSFARGIYFLPNVTSMVTVAFVWEWMLNPEYGLMNAGLRKVGVEGPGWLSDPAWAMPSVAAVSVWHGLGFGVLIYLAGLRAIPEEVHEAARIDGATSWKAFRYVTWPLLTPTTMFLTVMGVIGGFQVFQSVYIMTGGGPLDRTRVYLYYLWQSAFQNLEMGYASAMAVVLFAILMLLTLVQWRFYRGRLAHHS